MRVRLARTRDAEDVVRLIAGFRDYYGEQRPDDTALRAVVDQLLPDPGTEFLLAGDPPSGVAQLRFRDSVWTGVEDAWIEDLFVAPDARRAGVGRALVEACLQRARVRGCRRIQLDANERNEPALALYRSLGFASGSPERWEGGRNLLLARGL